MSKRVEKRDLPTKPCAVCGRPFAWRRKWAATFDEVRYCSERCRRSRRSGAQGREQQAERRAADGGDDRS